MPVGAGRSPYFGRLSFAADGNELVASCMLMGEKLRTFQSCLVRRVTAEAHGQLASLLQKSCSLAALGPAPLN